MESVLNTNSLLERLAGKFGEWVKHDPAVTDMLTVIVEKDHLTEVLEFLRDDPDSGFTFLTTLCGLHYPDSAQPYGLMVQLHNMRSNVRIRVKSFTADPVFSSLTGLWPAANWLERETYDFFGFRFEGHPDLRRILNMDSLEGWPLRKEFPLEDPFRQDKDDKLFGR